jgi:DNA-binding transcriptional MerR regulator
MKLYKSDVACDVCGITPRTLDYWVTTGVIAPSKGMRTKTHQRKYFLFTFEDLVRLKMVKGLRDAGASLGSIRTAISMLKEQPGSAWRKAWLITDGKSVFRPTNNVGILESLSKRESGQLAWSIIAVGKTQKWMRRKLKRYEEVNTDRFNATVLSWEDMTGGRDSARIGRRA